MVEISVNSLIVGITIFTQPRYMIYSMGFFYTAVCMLLYDIWQYNKIKQAEEQEISMKQRI